MVEPTKRGPMFKNPARLQELWNNLLPTKQIAEELGFYSSHNVCRTVRRLRKMGMDLVYRSVGHPKRDGRQRIYHRPPTPAQLQYWATVSLLMTERHAARRAAQGMKEVEVAYEIPSRPFVPNGVYRCQVCEGRTDDPNGHPSCRTAA